MRKPLSALFLLFSSASLHAGPRWIDRHDGGAGETDWVRASLISDDSLYVAGSVAEPDGTGAFVGRAYFAKLDVNTGVPLWRTRFGASEGPAGNYDCTGLVAAPGGLYAACHHGYDGYALMRLSAAGAVLWVRKQGADGGLNALLGVAADGAGGAWIFGRAEGGNTRLSHYSADGTIGGQITFGGVGAGAEVRAALVADDGDLILAGIAPQNGRAADAFVARLSPSGTPRYARYLGDAGASATDGFNALIAHQGTLFAAGFRRIGTIEQSSLYVAALDSVGNTLWQYDNQAAPGLGANAYALAHDGSALYVAGSRDLAVSDAAAVLIRLGADGSAQWARDVASPAAESVDLFQQVAIASDGSIAAAGYDSQPFGHQRYLLSRFDSEGRERSRQHYVHPSMGGSIAYTLQLDASGHAYLGGSSWTTTSRSDAVVVRFDNDSIVHADDFD